MAMQEERFSMGENSSHTLTFTPFDAKSYSSHQAVLCE